MSQVFAATRSSGIMLDLRHAQGSGMGVGPVTVPKTLKPPTTTTMISHHFTNQSKFDEAILIRSHILEIR